MTNKEKYIQYEKVNQIPFFSKSKWLDVVANNWEVAYCKTENGLDVFLPFVPEKKGIFSLVRNPHFTPYSAIIYDRSLATQKDQEQVVDFILDFAKKHSLFELDFLLDDNILETLPYQELRTNVLELGKETEQILLQQANKNTVRNIAKGQKLKIEQTEDIDLIYSLLQKSFEKQNKEYPHRKEIISKIIAFVSESNCGVVWLASDQTSKTTAHHHAVLIQIWDDTTSYYLAGGSDYQYKNSGAMFALQATAIKHANFLFQDETNKNRLKYYDFEGSQIEGIHQFFQGFGALEKKYARVQFKNSKVLEKLQQLKSKLK